MRRSWVCATISHYLGVYTDGVPIAAKIGGTSTADKSKEQEELDQVAGNAEDEIGERIAAMREQELLYGSQSLLATFGPMLVHICGSPHKFKVGTITLLVRSY